MRPNIIYIMADDLGYGDLASYGQTLIQTPNLDRLAAEGLRFTDHYAGHTVCRPSRLVLWTGKHVGHTGLIGNRPRSLTGKEATVARLLQEAGYATGGVGKWALGNVDSPDEIHDPGHPNRNGFDYWFGYMSQGNAHNYYPQFLWENDQRVSLAGNELDPAPEARGRVSSKRSTYAHDLLTDAALGFIERHQDEPFLLHVHWTIPHANNEGGRLTGDGMEIPDHGIYADRDWPTPEKGFVAMVTRMDADVGRILQRVEELNLDAKTLVLFTSDNGPHNEGEHDHDFFDSNGPLQGYKRSMYEGGIRVPLIARWPGTIEAGAVSDHVSAFYDFLPTACDLAGVEPPEDIDGISYVPTLLGSTNQKAHDYLYFASDEGETSLGVRHGNWKLVRYRAEDSPWQLYDLATDAGERNDMAAARPEVVRDIVDLLARDGLIR